MKSKGDKDNPLKSLNKYGLNKQQEQFCHLYAYSNNRGNGVLCYAEAYGIDLSDKSKYGTCKVNASKLLTDTNILDQIRDLYESTGLNDTVVDNELEFLIKQNADFGVKLGGIREYNQLKGRIKNRLGDDFSFKVKIKKSA